jgi:hypothetical protein
MEWLRSGAIQANHFEGNDGAAPTPIGHSLLHFNGDTRSS